MAIITNTINRLKGTLDQQPAQPPVTLDPVESLLSKVDTDNLQVGVNLPVTPGYIKDFQTGLFDKLTALGETDYQTPEMANFIAGLSDEQLKAINLGVGGIGAYQPLLDKATGTFDAAGVALGTLGDYSDTLAKLGADTLTQTQPAIDAALGAVTGTQDTIGSVGDQITGLTDATGAFDPSSYKQFMNPFEDDLVAQLREDIAESTGLQRQKQQEALSASGSAIGTRADKLRSDLSQKQLQAEIEGITQLRKAGYDDAMRRAQEAFEAQQARLLASKELGISGLLGAGKLGLGAGELGLGAGTLGLGATELGGGLIGAGAGLVGDQVTGLGTLGSLYGDAGSATQLGNITDINTLLGLGELTQTSDQATLDAQYKDLLASVTDPYTQLSILGDIFAGVPGGSGTLGLQTRPIAEFAGGGGGNTASQIAGLGLAGLGAYNQIFGGRGR
tara:strand:+ start:789 stop:2129 length:1341 start_codon:yes stop_codon:yes gene_type:complete